MERHKNRSDIQYLRPKDEAEGWSGRLEFHCTGPSGKPLTVFGDGSQTRSFCYVDDLVRGIVALLMVKSDKSVAERTDRTKFLLRSHDAILDSIHDPVNIGNPRELTVRGIAEIILKITGSKSVIEERPLPADDRRFVGRILRELKSLRLGAPESRTRGWYSGRPRSTFVRLCEVMGVR